MIENPYALTAFIYLVSAERSYHGYKLSYHSKDPQDTTTIAACRRGSHSKRGPRALSIVKFSNRKITTGEKFKEPWPDSRQQADRKGCGPVFCFFTLS